MKKKIKNMTAIFKSVVHGYPTAMVFERLSVLVTQPSLALAIRISCTELYKVSEQPHPRA